MVYYKPPKTPFPFTTHLQLHEQEIDLLHSMAAKSFHRRHEVDATQRPVSRDRPNPFLKRTQTNYTYSSSISASSTASFASDSDSHYQKSTLFPSIDKIPRTAPDHTSRWRPADDLPPIVTQTASTSSVNTYDSMYSGAEGEEIFDDDDEDDYSHITGRLDAGIGAGLQRERALMASEEEEAIPDALPPYRATVIDPTVRPSTPEAFSRLFPSLDRLSVKHDDLTSDGNMNLRVDTLVPASALIDQDYQMGSSRHPAARRPVSVQLFHLRMHDLPRREFSLRRYCRESGREVCSSKRIFQEPSAPPPRPAIRRSVSSVIRTVTTPFQRSSTHSTHHHTPPGLFRRRPSTGSGPAPTAGSSLSSGSSGRGSWHDGLTRRRRGSSSTAGGSGKAMQEDAPRPVPDSPQLITTEVIRLEFSNYGRVDLTRSPGKGYEFEWWGNRYLWRRSVDPNQVEGAVSFHLLREGDRGSATLIAHLVPENQSPNQVQAEEDAGGWIAPYHLWISDESVLDAAPDVAE